MFDDAGSYDRFMGRYSQLLAPEFADFAGVTGGTVIDVGCGPGALTSVLVERASGVAAVDPSESFVAAAQARYPGVDIRRAAAEELPFENGAFDVALAQLVVHFMSDPVRGVREMARVTRPGGTVAACVWDVAGGRSPMSPVWAASYKLGLGGERESDRAGTASGDLRRIFEQAGLEDIGEGEVTAVLEHATFEEWWEPFMHGVGPVGQALARLQPEDRNAVRAEAEASLGKPPILVSVVAWAVRGRA